MSGIDLAMSGDEGDACVMVLLLLRWRAKAPCEREADELARDADGEPERLGMRFNISIYLSYDLSVLLGGHCRGNHVEKLEGRVRDSIILLNSSISHFLEYK